MVLLGCVFELASSDSAGDGTKEAVASESLTTCVTSYTTSNGAHDATLALLALLWVVRVDSLVSVLT